MRRTPRPRPRQFHARLLVHSPSAPTSIWSIAYQLSKYPVYGLIVQLWIHYQALLLFLKGVDFQPHPQGSETWASKMIGSVMAPFFALQALLEKEEKEKKSGSASPPSAPRRSKGQPNGAGTEKKQS